MFHFELSLYSESMIKPDSFFELSIIEAAIKSLEIVQRDKERLGEVLEFSFEDQVICLISYYQIIDLETALAALTAKEPNLSVLKEDLKVFMEVMAYGLKGVRRDHPLALRMAQVFHKYKIPNGNCFAVYPFVELMYEEVKRQRSVYTMESEFKYFSESKIYKNLKVENGIPTIMAMLPPGQKYGGFVKAYLHVRYIQHKQWNWDFLGVLSRARADYNSKLHSNEERLEFFEKLAISPVDCIKWSFVFDKILPQHKNIHKIFDQVA